MPKRRSSAGDLAVARRMLALRLKIGLSQSDLGDRIGVTFQQVQKYETGANRVSIGRLIRIAQALNVPTSSLLTSESGNAPKAKSAGELDFLETAGALRLAKAYGRLENREAAAALVRLTESLAARARR